MKTKYLVYIALILTFSIVIIVQIKNNLQKNYEKTIENYADIKDIHNIINTSYNIPLIESVYKEDNSLKINAGLFHYGDINKDGVIDLYDVKTIKYILNNNLIYNEDEKKLSDINKNNVIDSDDLKLLDDYVSENISKKYSIDNNLEYCMLDIENVNACIWYKNNKFLVNDNNLKYFYVRYNNSLSSEFIYEYDDVNNLFSDIVIE